MEKRGPLVRGWTVAHGQRLRQLREVAGLSCNELAAKAGFSARALGDHERGVKRPHRNAVQHYAKVLDVRVEHLLDLDDDHAREPRVPEPWRLGSVVARTTLMASVQLALRFGHGFLGLEHLLLGLGTSASAPSPTARLAALIDPTLLRRRLSSLEGTLDDTVVLTPRLARISTTLPSGFQVDQLIDRLVRDPVHDLHELAGASLVPAEPGPWQGETEGDQAPGWAPRGRVRLLEVVGGPRDGRRFTDLKTGDRLGRHCQAEPPEMALLVGGVTDRRVSRHVLSWNGGGRIRVARRPLPVIRRGRPLTLQVGDCELLDGDLLRLSPSVSVRALAAPFD